MGLIWNTLRVTPFGDDSYDSLWQARVVDLAHPRCHPAVVLECLRKAADVVPYRPPKVCLEIP